MKHLLDVNVLLAAIWASHPMHAKASAWLTGKRVCLCPLSGLGFLRISSNPRAFNFTMDSARYGLMEFCAERRVEWITDDLLPLDSKPAKADQIMDTYLADLAAKHGLRFGTLDTGIRHPAAELVS
jgi:predicted nucleic acid-binding protein